MANIKADEFQGYHTFAYGAGSFEVFWHVEYGWFWWPCFPGCLPDGEPSGPFETSLDAWSNAREE